MARNVLIFSDGTGQGAHIPLAAPTNVARLWRATETFPATEQVARYDPGLGARDGAPWGYNLLSMLTGLGISRNIKKCYARLIELYEPGDRVFLFGFSRGAYTVRSLGGVLSLCGIPTRDAKGRDPRRDPAARRALVEEAVEKVYKHYGSDEKKQERVKRGSDFRRDYESHYDVEPFVPYFIGVWDTVRALGIPGSSGLVFWRHAFHDATLNARVAYARQALSIDENRDVFEPVIWDETPDDRNGRIRQVWFPGVHSDIGGGYDDTRLADIALSWMVDEATALPHPLLVDRAMLNIAEPLAFDAPQHDQRTGWGKLWWPGTRERFAPELLREDEVQRRFAADRVETAHGPRPYRPQALHRHRDYEKYYRS